MNTISITRGVRNSVTLYVDVLFAINFSMDYVSLFLCGKILHKKLPKLRIIIASTIGGIYGVLTLIFKLNVVLEITICLLIALIMCVITYYEKNIKSLSICIVLFWVTSSLLGGIMSFLYTIANKLLDEYITSYTYETVYNGARFFVIASVTVLVTTFVGKIFMNNKDRRTVPIKIYFKNKEYSLVALCDSGNMLKDPLSGKSVILVTIECEIGKEINNEDELHKRFIPYKDISGSGVLKGVIPTKILIEGKEVSGVVAPVYQKSFDGNDALLPISLL